MFGMVSRCSTGRAAMAPVMAPVVAPEVAPVTLKRSPVSDDTSVLTLAVACQTH